MARSAFPSPLKSPTATDVGVFPVANGLPLAVVNPPLPFPSNTVRLLLLPLVTARSAFPSPLKSPTATEFGQLPTANGLPLAAENPPPPFPSNTVTLLLPQFATAKSAFPSPLKSPTATDDGPLSAANGLPLAAANVPPGIA